MIAQRTFVAAALLTVGCASSPASHDTFIDSHGGDPAGSTGGEIARWETTSDGSLRVPLASGLSWGAASTAGALLNVRATEGPTFLVVMRLSLPALPTHPAGDAVADDFSCAEAHRAQIVEATTKSGVIITPPQIARDPIGGRVRPRLHYAVPLQARTANAAPAQELSSWTYFVDKRTPSSCLGLGVTTIVHASAADRSQPDNEELHRLERVFSIAAEGAALP